MTMKLYDGALSGNAYKIRLFLSLLGLEHELVPVDLRSGENRTAGYLEKNPRGQIPVLEDGDVTIWDSQAILVYLARRYAAEDWLPLQAGPMARVMQWLAVAENELLFGLARARAVKKFGRDFDLDACQQYGIAGLRVLDGHLQKRDWLAGERPTVADVACFPYVALAPEGDISLDEYTALPGWIDRIRSLPGFVGMEGIPGPNDS